MIKSYYIIGITALVLLFPPFVESIGRLARILMQAFRITADGLY